MTAYRTSFSGKASSMSAHFLSREESDELDRRTPNGWRFYSFQRRAHFVGLCWPLRSAQLFSRCHHWSRRRDSQCFSSAWIHETSRALYCRLSRRMPRKRKPSRCIATREPAWWISFEKRVAFVSRVKFCVVENLLHVLFLPFEMIRWIIYVVARSRLRAEVAQRKRIGEEEEENRTVQVRRMRRYFGSTPAAFPFLFSSSRHAKTIPYRALPLLLLR